MGIAFLVVGIEIDYDEFMEEDKFDFIKEYINENEYNINGGRVYKNFNGDCEENNAIVIFGDSIASDDGEDISTNTLEEIKEKAEKVENNLKDIFDKVKSVTEKDVKLHLVLEQDLY